MVIDKLNLMDQSNNTRKDMENWCLQSENVDVFYGEKQVIKNVSLNIKPNTVTAFIGPSGCGKSTFLRLFNRMNDYIDNFRMEGLIHIQGQNIYDKHIRVEDLRKHVGMVFQKPNPFPKSIYENVAYGLKLQGINKKSVLNEAVERALKNVVLWDEVKDDLKKSAMELSGGQQQRLCIARSLAVEPDVILMDEPASALDPISSAKLEELITTLKAKYTIIIVTHNMQQAKRVSDDTAFFYLGELIEYGATTRIFDNPTEKQTQNYFSGRFG